MNKNLINSRKMRNNDERRILKRILNNFITTIIKSQYNNGYRLNNNTTNIVSTHVTPQWDKFEATIESWHIRNPPTVHHVLYHFVCGATEPRLGRQWQRNGTKKEEKDTLATCVSRIVVAFFSFQKRLVRL